MRPEWRPPGGNGLCRVLKENSLSGPCEGGRTSRLQNTEPEPMARVPSLVPWELWGRRRPCSRLGVLIPNVSRRAPCVQEARASPAPVRTRGQPRPPAAPSRGRIQRTCTLRGSCTSVLSGLGDRRRPRPRPPELPTPRLCPGHLAAAIRAPCGVSARCAGGWPGAGRSAEPWLFSRPGRWGPTLFTGPSKG